MEGSTSRLHRKRLLQQSAPLGLAGYNQARNDLEVLPGLLLRPEHLAVFGFLQRLKLEGRPAVHVTRGAR